VLIFNTLPGVVIGIRVSMLLLIYRSFAATIESTKVISATPGARAMNLTPTEVRECTQRQVTRNRIDPRNAEALLIFPSNFANIVRATTTIGPALAAATAS
jgi:MFS superfamily sulfate permease-like transporter